MSATLLQLRDQCIIDAGIEGQPKFPTTRLNRMINLAQRYVQTNLNGLGLKKWEAVDILTMVVAPAGFSGIPSLISDLSVDCPNMLESPNSIIFIETLAAGGIYGVAYEIDIRNFQEQLENTYLAPTTKKPIFMRLVNKIYLFPSTLASAIAYYYKAITDLASDSATTEIPIEFEDFIIKKVILDIDDILGKLQDKDLAQRQLEKDINATYEKFLGKQQELNRIKSNDKVKLQ